MIIKAAAENTQLSCRLQDSGGGTGTGDDNNMRRLIQVLFQTEISPVCSQCAAHYMDISPSRQSVSVAVCVVLAKPIN